MELRHRERADGLIAAVAVAAIVAISLAAAARRRVLRGVPLVRTRREPDESPATDTTDTITAPASRTG